MAKHTLEFEDDYNFALIGISSHAKDYRLCWAINNNLNLEFKKTDPLEIKGKKKSTSAFFSMFEYSQEENFIDYFLLSNLSEAKSDSIKGNVLFKEEKGITTQYENEYLLPEHKNLNYFLIVKGEVSKQLTDELVKKVKEIDIVQTAVSIDVSTLKSKHHLIF